MKPKIILTIMGGTLSNVASNQPIDYVLIDHDNISQGGRLVEQFEQDDTFDDGKAHELYKEPTDTISRGVRRSLKLINF